MGLVWTGVTLKAWPKTVRPLRFGDFEAESWDDWFKRCGSRWSHLDPRVLEQWVHRHWGLSEYFGLPLQRMVSDVRTFTTEEILAFGHAEVMDDPEPEQWLRDHLRGHYEPRVTMESTGTWDMPMLVAGSDDGFDYRGRRYPHVHWLIEGHIRMRYLRAMAATGDTAPTHEVIVLRLRRRVSRT